MSIENPVTRRQIGNKILGDPHEAVSVKGRSGWVWLRNMGAI